MNQLQSAYVLILVLLLSACNQSSSTKIDRITTIEPIDIDTLVIQPTLKRNPYQLPIIDTKAKYDSIVELDSNQLLVDLEKYIPTIALDIRYATDDNFTGEVIYTSPKAYVRLPLAVALKEIQDSLRLHGLGLKVFDAYRPYAATLKFFEVYHDSTFVANPRKGSRHNRACAVDVTLISLETGVEFEMPTVFDDFSKKAHARYTNSDKAVVQNRTFLFSVMSYYGFKNYAREWWHFDYQGWQKYPLMDLTFEELEKN